jgi:hypothetical protein
MSNLSSIGFVADTQEEFQQLFDYCYNNGEKIICSDGVYYKYSDDSGAELYGQLSNQREFLGMNPHFRGESRRRVSLTDCYTYMDSSLDGGFYCLAEPYTESKDTTGLYPFYCEIPDFKTIEPLNFPVFIDLQLSAFAGELQIYNDESTFSDQQTKYASKSFIPLDFVEEKRDLPEGFAFFTGIIKKWERRKNIQSDRVFYWFLVDSYGGEIDVISDPEFINTEPKIGGVVQGSFWLSGKLIDPQKSQE